METGASAAQKGAPSPTQGETKPSIQEGESDIKDIIDKAQVSLVLDTYDDIFSDFDPRPYDQRALSGDFLDAARHGTSSNSKMPECRILQEVESNHEHRGGYKYDSYRRGAYAGH